MHPLVGPVDDSALGLEGVRLGAGEKLTLDGSDDDSLLFVHEGGGTVTVAGASHPLAVPGAALALAGEDAVVVGGADGVALVRARVGANADRHALLGEREVIVALDAAGIGSASGARSFQVLLGPDNGSTRATMFVGYVPPGKAPWHYHLYDEIVWVHRGSARLHLGEHVEDMEPGTAFRLRPRELHIVENTSADEVLQVLGIFTPAGTPSAAFLPPEVAAEYRFSG